MNAYPLSWPEAYPRTHNRKKALFKAAPFGHCRDQLIHELKLLGAKDIILSTNVPLRQDGLPYADFERRNITDPGVAVYFKYKGNQKVLSCDRWNRIEFNLHALELTVAAMRGLERWGASAILERAFTGFTALPAPPQWWDVLGVRKETPLQECEQVYRDRIFKAHPDRGGTEGKAADLNWAISRAREEAA